VKIAQYLARTIEIFNVNAVQYYAQFDTVIGMCATQNRERAGIFAAIYIHSYKSVVIAAFLIGGLCMVELRSTIKIYVCIYVPFCRTIRV
jgi:hypothetical protein